MDDAVLLNSKYFDALEGSAVVKLHGSGHISQSVYIESSQ